MVARTQLAALDHNANTGRQQATVSKGENEEELRYKVVFPKQTKEWVAKPIMEKTREHLKPILDSIVATLLQNLGLPKQMSLQSTYQDFLILYKHTNTYFIVVIPKSTMYV